ncbi:MAG: cytochrome c [Gemmatimonadales bacterium]|nr:cytochrome c [Gemmatimonadales bacterium]
MRGLTLCSLVALAALLGAHRGQTPATGRDVYRTRCAMCHGPEGRGDGPAGAALTPRATNLTVGADLTAVSDSVVRAIVTSGRRGMPAFGRMLTRAQTDSVVAYLRTLRH